MVLKSLKQESPPSQDHSTEGESPPALNFPSPNTVAQSDLLQDAVFPTWKDNAAHQNLDSPEELQKQDPLATQIWKLYSKTKTRLPNQERMENLTWRMMAMNLKRREREQALYIALLSLDRTLIADRFPALCKRVSPYRRRRLPAGSLSNSEARWTKPQQILRLMR